MFQIRMIYLCIQLIRIQLKPLQTQYMYWEIFEYLQCIESIWKMFPFLFTANLFENVFRLTKQKKNTIYCFKKKKISLFSFQRRYSMCKQNSQGKEHDNNLHIIDISTTIPTMDLFVHVLLKKKRLIWMSSYLTYPLYGSFYVYKYHYVYDVIQSEKKNICFLYSNINLTFAFQWKSRKKKNNTIYVATDRRLSYYRSAVNSVVVWHGKQFCSCSFSFHEIIANFPIFI